MNNWTDYISQNPKIMVGKPVIAGTRIPVDLILEKMAAGWIITDLLEAYPQLTEASISACLHFSNIQNHLK